MIRRGHIRESGKGPLHELRQNLAGRARQAVRLWRATRLRLRVEVLPQAGQGIAKSRDATFRRDGGTASYHHMPGLGQALGIERHG